MRSLMPDTQSGRLLKAFVLHFPRYVGGREAFGDDFYTARNRFGDTLKPCGFEVVGHRTGRDPGERKGNHWIWRFASKAIYREAAILVRSWETDEELDVLRARDELRRSSDPDDQRRLPLGG